MRSHAGPCAVLVLLASTVPSPAAVNPLDPGLAKAAAYGRKLPNNAASSMCVDCHSYNPTPWYGSHFVLHVDPGSGKLRTTNSGGGWEKAAFGIRDGGEFFKIGGWDSTCLGAGGVSKYADAATLLTVIFGEAPPDGTFPGRRYESSKNGMAETELICESCHSMLYPVPGTALLLAKITDGSDQENPQEGRTSPLCVGCHGFLYQDNRANSINANWDDPRNVSDITGKKKGNNEIHWVGGIPFPRNHHVMSGDLIDLPLAAECLLYRDVAVLSDTMVSKPIRMDSRNGTMPIRKAVLPPIEPSRDPRNLHCVTCHAPGHGGEKSMGATILRGDDLKGRDSGVGIDRISDGREWGEYSDAKFCSLCHE